MKKLYIGFALLALLMAALPCRAADMAASLGADTLQDALPRDARARLEGLSPMEAGDWAEHLRTLLRSAWEENDSALSTGLRSALTILGIAALGAIAQSMLRAVDRPMPVVTITTCLAVTAVALGESTGMLHSASAAIGQMNLFSKALLPVMTAACTAAGQAITAAGRHAIVVFLIDVIITTIDAAAVPLLYSNIALQLASAASGSETLAKLTMQLKSFLHSFLRILLTMFMTYFALSGVIRGSADAMTVRTLKLSMSSALPVVGSIMSDAASAVLIGARIVRDSTGIFGMLGLLAIGLVPFAGLGIRCLCMRLAALLSGIGSDGTFSRFVDGIADSFGLLVGLYGTCMLLLLLSVFAGMSAWGMGG